MTLEKIFEFQKKSLEVLGDMIKELDDEDLMKIYQPTEDKTDFIAQFEMGVSFFRKQGNIQLLTIRDGGHNSDVLIAASNHTYHKNEWVFDSFARNIECLTK